MARRDDPFQDNDGLVSRIYANESESIEWPPVSAVEKFPGGVGAALAELRAGEKSNSFAPIEFMKGAGTVGEVLLEAIETADVQPPNPVGQPVEQGVLSPEAVRHGQELIRRLQEEKKIMVAGGAPAAPPESPAVALAHNDPARVAIAAKIAAVRERAIRRIGKKLGVPFTQMPLPGPGDFVDLKPYRGGIVVFSTPMSGIPVWTHLSHRSGRSPLCGADGKGRLCAGTFLALGSAKEADLSRPYKLVVVGHAKGTHTSDGRCSINARIPQGYDLTLNVPGAMGVLAATDAHLIGNTFWEKSGGIAIWGGAFPPEPGQVGAMVSPLCLSEEVAYKDPCCPRPCFGDSDVLAARVAGDESRGVDYSFPGHEAHYHQDVVTAVTRAWAWFEHAFLAYLEATSGFIPGANFAVAENEAPLWSLYSGELSRRKSSVDMSAVRIAEVDDQIKTLKERRAGQVTRHKRLQAELASAPKRPLGFLKMLRESRDYHLAEIAKAGVLVDVEWCVDSLKARIPAVRFALDGVDSGSGHVGDPSMALLPESMRLALATVFKGEVVLGPYSVVVDAGLGVAVQPLPRTPFVMYEGQRFYHPHIQPTGQLCWGNYGELVEETRRNADPYALLWAVGQVLSAYTEADAYVPIRKFATERLRGVLFEQYVTDFQRVRGGFSKPEDVAKWVRRLPDRRFQTLHSRAMQSWHRDDDASSAIDMPQSVFSFYRANASDQPVSYLVMGARMLPYLRSDTSCLRWWTPLPRRYQSDARLKGEGAEALSPQKEGQCHGLWCGVADLVGPVPLPERASIGICASVEMGALKDGAEAAAASSGLPAVSVPGAFKMAVGAVETSKSALVRGDWVFHHLYGEGVVRSVLSGIVVVRFFGLRALPDVTFGEGGLCEELRLDRYGAPPSSSAPAQRDVLRPCTRTACLLSLSERELNNLWLSSLWPEARLEDSPPGTAAASLQHLLEAFDLRSRQMKFAGVASSSGADIFRYEPAPRRGSDGRLGDIGKYVKLHSSVYHHTWGFGVVASSSRDSKEVEVCFPSPHIRSGLHGGSGRYNFSMSRNFLAGRECRCPSVASPDEDLMVSCEARSCLVPVEGLAFRSYLRGLLNTLAGIALDEHRRDVSYDAVLGELLCCNFSPAAPAVYFKGGSSLLTVLAAVAGYPTKSLGEWRGPAL